MRRAILVLFVIVSLGTIVIPATKRTLRRALRFAAHFLLSVRSHPLRLDNETTLVIAPHQDDGTLGCGGLVFQKRLAGEPVHVLYLTDGSASHPGHPLLTPDRLALLRKKEALVAKSRLYVDSACIHFLNLPDSRLPHLADAERDFAINRLTTVLGSIRPRTILLPFRHDGSSEHEAGFHLIKAALVHLDFRPRLLEYPVWANYRSALLLRPALTAIRVHRFAFPGYGSHKLHALSAYSSQFEPIAPWTQAVVPSDFAESFSSEQEFFFEMYP